MEQNCQLRCYGNDSFVLSLLPTSGREIKTPPAEGRIFFRVG